MSTSEFEAESVLQDENLSMQDLVSLQKAQLRAVVKCLEIKVPLAAKKDAMVLAIAAPLGIEDEEGPVESSVELDVVVQNGSSQCGCRTSLLYHVYLQGT